MPDIALAPYLDQWKLEAVGASFATSTAILQPVTHQNGLAAMVRVEIQDTGDTSGTDLLQAWAGNSAAQIYAREGPALLMERAVGTKNLIEMAQTGNDEAATQILCETAHRLHAQKITQPTSLIPLEHWFRSLTEPSHTGLLATSADTARGLLEQRHHPVPLHGDLHHGNVLDFGARGWLAIDPKGLWGDRAFEYVAIFTNPDLSAPERPVAACAFERRFAQICKASNLPATLLRDWIIASAGLSAAWFIEDNNPLAAIPLDIAARALNLGLPDAD